MQERYKFSLFSVSHINLHELNRMFVPNQVEIEITADNWKDFIQQSGIHLIWSHESRFFSRFEISFSSWVKNLQRSFFSDLFVFLMLIFHSAHSEPMMSMLHFALFCYGIFWMIFLCSPSLLNSGDQIELANRWYLLRASPQRSQVRNSSFSHQVVMWVPSFVQTSNAKKHNYWTKLKIP